MYDKQHNNKEQLHTPLYKLEERRAALFLQKKDIDDMLRGLDEVQGLCEQALGKQLTGKTP